jgi:hypothetical protein
MNRVTVWQWLGIEPVDVVSSLAAVVVVLAPAWGALTR